MPISPIRQQQLVLKELGFRNFISTSDDSFFKQISTEEMRQGIYCIAFSDGTFYIGQTTDIQKRFSQHKNKHGDITHISFFQHTACDILFLEKDLIQKAENFGVHLRNKEYTASAIDKVNGLTSIIDNTSQTAWLYRDDPQFRANSGCPHHNVELSESKTNKKFIRLLKHTQYGYIISIAFQYLSLCIPFPGLTEKTYWSISCLPGTTQGDLKRIFCFNIHMMETFVLFNARKRSEDFYALLNISSKVFTNHFGSNNNFTQNYKNCVVFTPNYKSAGHDQLSIELSGAETLKNILQLPPIIHAAKVLNLHLMQKGKNIYGKHHCYELSKAIFSKQVLQ